MNNEKLVSIIMPAYNCQKYISESIESVLRQTYENWELVIIDDCSTDNTNQIIKSYKVIDSRIILFENVSNMGAAYSRNYAVKKANGTYLAFIDADDIWENDKLEKQINYMDCNNISFSCTSYGKIDSNSNILKKQCIARKIYHYTDMLKRCPGNSTIVYNCKLLGKIEGPDIKKRNDFAMFLQVIKKSGTAYGLEEILGYHRVHDDSISIRKKNLVVYQWKVYYKIEQLGMVKSIYYILYKIIQTLLNHNG